MFYKNWMSYIKDDAKITKIVMPGSHNSATMGMSKLARCQCGSLYEQYLCGVRYFDIRIKAKRNGELIVAHGVMNGMPLSRAFESLRKIFEESDEFFVINLQTYMNQKIGPFKLSYGGNTAETNRLIKEYLSPEKYALTDFEKIGGVTTGDIRKSGKKYILINEEKEYDYSFDGILIGPWDSVVYGYKPEKFTVHYKMFKNCGNLERVILPSDAGKIIIEERAFIYCDSLIGVYNLAKVTEIGKLAFYGCKALETFTVPEGVRTIRQRTFYGCEYLKNIYLHSGIKKIGKNAFKDCPRLTVNYEGTKFQYGKISKGEDIKKLSAKVKYNADYHPLLENVKASVSADKTVLSWKKDKNADGYRLYTLSGGALKKIADTKNTNYTFKKLEQGRAYTLFVRAYTVRAGKKLLAPQKECAVITTGVNRVSSLAGSKVKMKRLTLSWDKAEGTSGYRVYILKDGSWEKVADTKACTYTVTGLKGGTCYAFGIRAKEKANGKIYWSDIEFISVKTRPAQVKSLKAERLQKKEATLYWGEVKGADGYTVYRKTENGGWKAVREHTAKESYTVKNLKPGTEYTFAVRSYTKPFTNNYKVKNYTENYTEITVVTRK